MLRTRVGLRPGRVVDTSGKVVGRVDATELVTIGQRRGLGIGGGARRYALSVDPAVGTVVVGDLDDLMTDAVELTDVTWVDGPVIGAVEAQCSAHGAAVEATLDGATVRFAEAHRRVAPGQSVVLYRCDVMLGGGIAA